MPTTAKTGTTRLATSAVKAVHQRNMKAATAIDRSLAETETALTSLQAHADRDTKRLVRDLTKTVRSARRDATKLSRAVQADVERAGFQPPRARS
jgi:hypothetical protein